jgi:hypothetical protein
MQMQETFEARIGRRRNGQNAPPITSFSYKHWWNKKLALCGTTSPPGEKLWNILTT